MDFHQALNTFIGEITPQPWEYTDSAGVTLTVIPAGLREEPGRAEVVIRVTVDRHRAAEIGVTTADMPGLIGALTGGAGWSHETTLSDTLTVTPDTGGVFGLTVTEFDWSTAGRDDRVAVVELPAAQRMPLVSALARAADVARGWEG